MISVRMYILAILCFAVSISNGQSWQKIDEGVKASINNIKIEIQFYNPSIVRVLKSPTGRRFTKESLSVIEKPVKTAFIIKQNGSLFQLKSEKLELKFKFEIGS